MSLGAAHILVSARSAPCCRGPDLGTRLLTSFLRRSGALLPVQQHPGPQTRRRTHSRWLSSKHPRRPVRAHVWRNSRPRGARLRADPPWRSCPTGARHEKDRERRVWKLAMRFWYGHRSDQWDDRGIRNGAASTAGVDRLPSQREGSFRYERGFRHSSVDSPGQRCPVLGGLNTGRGMVHGGRGGACRSTGADWPLPPPADSASNSESLPPAETPA